MKTKIWVSLGVVFLMVVGAIFVTLSSSSSSPTKLEISNFDNSTEIINSGITLSEVSSHNNENDCWLVIDGQVYDVTRYIPMHPGGRDKIIAFCGKDATSAFDSKHSPSAKKGLVNFWLEN
jgi:cytochrome b involved in lipid metabolism